MERQNRQNEPGTMRDALLERVRREAPAEAGVYLFRDREGGLLYVGKSVNLRRRMASYFSGGAQGAGLRTAVLRIDRLVFGIHDFEFRVTGFELLALIEEDRLIKNFRPPYNIRQKQHEENCWLVLTEDAFPVLKTVGDPVATPGLRTFGPLRDRFFAGELLDVVRTCFGIRSCGAAEPENSCLNRDIGLCSGPCRGDVAREDYAAAVAKAAAFIEGDETVVVPALEAAMEKYAAGLEFEKATRMRDRIRLSRNFCRRQRFIRRFREGCLAVREKGDPESSGLTHLFVRGAHSAHAGQLATEEATAAARRILAAGLPAEDSRCVTDRAHIVFGWLKRHGKAADCSRLSCSSRDAVIDSAPPEWLG